eukprot:XP_001695149.1 predicted protein [Chlamydomonas reinhardtii]
MSGEGGGMCRTRAALATYCRVAIGPVAAPAVGVGDGRWGAAAAGSSPSLRAASPLPPKRMADGGRGGGRMGLLGGTNRTSKHLPWMLGADTTSAGPGGWGHARVPCEASDANW